MIRLMLVDDHAVVREGYRRLLEQRGDVSIVAEASDGVSALSLWRDTQPDVSVIDLTLPDMGGIELIGRILQRDSQARLLAFSMHRDALWATQALRAGALGYVTKSSAPTVLLHAVHEVVQRRRILSPDVAGDVALTLIDGNADPAATLSPREFEILRLLLAGQRVEQIAQSLSLSPKTVHNTHYQIKAKLGVKTDLELARLAVRLGWMSDPLPATPPAG